MRSVCDRQNSPHRAILPISGVWASAITASSGPLETCQCRALRLSSLDWQERGTQDSNLESPVLETGAYRPVERSRLLDRKSYGARFGAVARSAPRLRSAARASGVSAYHPEMRDPISHAFDSLSDPSDPIAGELAGSLGLLPEHVRDGC